MNSSDFIEDFKDHLLSLPYAKYTSGETDIAIRCPFCGDSIKHVDSTHFYIKVAGMDDGDPPIYHCYRCDVGGVFKTDTLKMLDLFDKDLNIALGRYNKKALKGSRFSKAINANRKTLVLPKYQREDFDKLQEIQVRYIEKRLGIHLSNEDLMKYKIVIKMRDVLAYNNIRKMTHKDFIVNTLNDYFVGFANATNEFIHLRNILPKYHTLNNRYFIYNIHNTIETSNKFYIIPTKLDMHNTIDVILTEGIFDIIGVYNHIYDCDDENKIYCAVCGSGYLSAIRYLVKRGIVNFNIKIYSDNEKNRGRRFYDRLKKDISAYYSKPMEIYYNNLEKDFGVTEDRIDVSRIKI